MSVLTDQVFYLFMVIISFLLLFGILLMYNSLVPWYESDSPYVQAESDSPCSNDIYSKQCTTEEFNKYCSSYDVTGKPKVLDSGAEAACKSVCLAVNSGTVTDDYAFCAYMPTCGNVTAAISAQYIERCISDVCRIDQLQSCTDRDVGMLCTSGVSSHANCKSHCQNNTGYSCTWLSWPDAGGYVLNIVCPRYMCNVEPNDEVVLSVF